MLPKVDWARPVQALRTSSIIVTTTANRIAGDRWGGVDSDIDGFCIFRNESDTYAAVSMVLPPWSEVGRNPRIGAER
jgi:hypothetical protein